MANNYNIAQDLGPTNALITTVDTVVDDIRAVDVVAIRLDIATVDTVVDDIRTVDVPALAADIAAIGDLSAKEKSLLGIGTFPGFRDCFNKVADAAAPDATYWNVIEDGASTVQVKHTPEPGILEMISSVNIEDAIVFTKDKWLFALKNGVNSVHMKGRFKFELNGGNGSWGLGFLIFSNADPAVFELIAANQYVASIVIGTAYSSDGAVAENTDLSAFISESTWFDCEIVISAADVKYYVNEILRATHTTRVPDAVWQASLAIMRGGVAGNVELEDEEVELWCE